MYNGPPRPSMWRTVCVCDIVRFQFVALFPITLFGLKLGLYSVHLLK